MERVLHERGIHDVPDLQLTYPHRRIAVSPALVGRSGLYFNGLNEAKANAQAYDASARAQLRALSFELTGIAHKS